MNEQILADRKKDIPTIDEVTTILWTKEMGQRLTIARMKMLKEQREIGQVLGVTQGTISRIENGRIDVCEKITVAALKKLLEKHFGYVIYGTGAERYSIGHITKTYWDTRLRVKRKNKGAYSKSRIL